jgi:arsenite methyltransferase
LRRHIPGSKPQHFVHWSNAPTNLLRIRHSELTGLTSRSVDARPDPGVGVRHPVCVKEKAPDIWAEWLAVHRSGGDPGVRRQMLEGLANVRDQVLDRAQLAEGETLLDVGCGEGLIGFGALERGAGHVIFSDISEDLLEVCRAAAVELGAEDRCSFVQAGAEDLAQIAEGSIDLVATRSVLIYVKDKRRAFEEFLRVLRPGGRAVVWEPINRFGMDERRQGFWGYPGNGVSDLVERVERVYEEIQPPDDPMLDFDERDLVALAEQAGFFPIELELNAEIRAMEPRPWEPFLNSSGNPRIPTISEAMNRALSPEERERFAEHLRPLVEEGKGVTRSAIALLRAVKPS